MLFFCLSRKDVYSFLRIKRLPAISLRHIVEEPVLWMLFCFPISIVMSCLLASYSTATFSGDTAQLPRRGLSHRVLT